MIVIDNELYHIFLKNARNKFKVGTGLLTINLLATLNANRPPA